MRGKEKLGVWDKLLHITIYKTDKPGWLMYSTGNYNNGEESEKIYMHLYIYIQFVIHLKIMQYCKAAII